MEHCERYEALIGAVVDGEATQKEREELMAHLAGCPACRAVYGEWMAMHAAFAELEAEVPGNLTGDVMAKVRAQRQIKKPRHYWWQMTAAAACLALIVFGCANLGFTRPSEKLPDAAGGTLSYAAPAPEENGQAGGAQASEPEARPDSGAVYNAAQEDPANLARETQSGETEASDQEIMDDVLTYFGSGAPKAAAVQSAEDEAEVPTEAVPCPTLSSSAPELEAWVAEHIPAEGYSAGEDGAQAWLLTETEYQELTDYLEREGIPYTLDGGEPAAGGEDSRGVVCVVYLEEKSEPVS